MVSMGNRGSQPKSLGCPRGSTAAAAHAAKFLPQRPGGKGRSAVAAIGWRRCSRPCGNRRPIIATGGPLTRDDRTAEPWWCQSIIALSCRCVFHNPDVPGPSSSFHTANFPPSIPLVGLLANWLDVIALAVGRRARRLHGLLHGATAGTAQSRQQKIKQANELTRRQRSGCSRSSVTSGDEFRRRCD